MTALTPRGFGREVDLPNALDAEKKDNGRKPEGAGSGGAAGVGSDDPAAASEKAPDDYQLSRAVDLLRGLALFGKVNGGE